MQDLIERRAALTALCEDCLRKYDGICPHPASRCVEFRTIKQLPAIDAEPVRHGRWIVNDRNPDYADCTHCGLSEWLGANGSREYAETLLSGFKKFCPNCGARMDAEDINVFTKDGMTNGDKIRVMDDEELVEFLMNADANICDFCDMKYPENCLSHSCEGEDCKTEILKWLKQEVSEDAGSKTD